MTLRHLINFEHQGSWSLQRAVTGEIAALELVGGANSFTKSLTRLALSILHKGQSIPSSIRVLSMVQSINYSSELKMP